MDAIEVIKARRSGVEFSRLAFTAAMPGTADDGASVIPVRSLEPGKTRGQRAAETRKANRAAAEAKTIEAAREAGLATELPGALTDPTAPADGSDLHEIPAILKRTA